MEKDVTAGTESTAVMERREASTERREASTEDTARLQNPTTRTVERR